MIDWANNSFTSIDEVKNRQQINTLCDKCMSAGTAKVRSMKRLKAGFYWLCKKCQNSNPNRIKKIAQSCKEKWQDPAYAELVKNNQLISMNTEQYKEMQRKLATKRWDSKEYRNDIINKIKITTSTENYKIRMSELSRNMWNNEDLKKQMLNSRRTSEYIKNQSEVHKLLWQDEEYKNKMKEIHSSEEWKNKMAAINASQPRCSSIQTILYSILDDLNIKYYKEYDNKPADPECKVGPYNWDCVIPRNNQKTLLIDCQGDYWHNRSEAIVRDVQKMSYINNNLANLYEPKYIWEHEFKCKDKIIELIKYWTGITQIELADFDFKDVAIRKATSEDYKLLLSKYHYLANAGRGGIAYGAYLNNELIGVCVFSPLIRQNISIDGYRQEEIRELSRLCIHPKYQKKNFASWFVSRCVKQLDAKYKCIISYCDKTFNHDGAIYKACNFVQDSVIKPDYWYVDNTGWVMHKKTLYNHAMKMMQTESEFAGQHSYTKIYGKEKLRFIYKR